MLHQPCRATPCFPRRSLSHAPRWPPTSERPLCSNGSTGSVTESPATKFSSAPACWVSRYAMTDSQKLVKKLDTGPVEERRPAGTGLPGSQRRPASTKACRRNPGHGEMTCRAGRAQVTTADNEDVTRFYLRGAQHALSAMPTAPYPASQF